MLEIFIYENVIFTTKTTKQIIIHKDFSHIFFMGKAIKRP